MSKWSPNVLCNSFTVSGLTFRTWIHFEFIFVYDVKKCFKNHILHVAVHFPQHHLLKDCLSSVIYSCLLSHRLIDHTCGFTSGLSTLFHWSMCLFLYQWHAMLITVLLLHNTVWTDGTLYLQLCIFSSRFLISVIS